MTSALSITRVFACIGGLVGWSAPVVAQQTTPPAVDTLWATVHDHRIAFFVHGDPAAPTVVLEPGGASHGAWGTLPSQIAEFARVVTYDRPGYGASERCPLPRSASVIAKELRDALTALGIRSPFVLGGWSLGGSFVRVFGAMYPEAVAGLVLIDPAPDDFYDRAAREHPTQWKSMLDEQNRRMATRPEGHRAEWAVWDATMSETRKSDSGIKAPVVLLTATRDEDGLQPIWIDEHRNWARRMPNVRHVLVEDAGHAIYREKPGVVINALRDMLPSTTR
jgi:pimeloyl-ACP methyl ester carboxylesterase